MTILGLCLAILLTPGISKEAASRGCMMAPNFVDSGERHNQDPYVLAAIAWRESNFNPKLIGSSGECGTMQVLPQYSAFTCQELQGRFGVEGGTRALKGWRGKGSIGRALYRYNCGYRNLGRCERYSKDVLRKASALRKHNPIQMADHEKEIEETIRGVGKVDHPGSLPCRNDGGGRPRVSRRDRPSRKGNPRAHVQRSAPLLSRG